MSYLLLLLPLSILGADCSADAMLGELSALATGTADTPEPVMGSDGSTTSSTTATKQDIEFLGLDSYVIDGVPSSWTQTRPMLSLSPDAARRIRAGKTQQGVGIGLSIAAAVSGVIALGLTGMQSCDYNYYTMSVDCYDNRGPSLGVGFGVFVPLTTTGLILLFSGLNQKKKAVGAYYVDPYWDGAP